MAEMLPCLSFEQSKVLHDLGLRIPEPTWVWTQDGAVLTLRGLPGSGIDAIAAPTTDELLRAWAVMDNTWRIDMRTAPTGTSIRAANKAWVNGQLNRNPRLIEKSDDEPVDALAAAVAAVLEEQDGMG